MRPDFESRNQQMYQDRVIDKMTLHKVAKKYDISKERVRQIVDTLEHKRRRHVRADIADGEFPDSFLIEDIDLSNRVRNCLKNARIFTVGQVKNTDVNDLFRIKNFGHSSYRELRDVIWGDHPVEVRVNTIGLKLKISEADFLKELLQIYLKEPTEINSEEIKGGENENS